MRIILFVLISTFIFTSIARADSPVDSAVEEKSYYDDSRHGWWWYEDPPKQEDRKDDQEKKPQPKRKLPSMKDYTAKELWNMHPDNFQPLIKEFLKKAVQNPTIENVRDFYVMVDIARMKANVFQSVAGAAWQKYPELNLNAAIPVLPVGRLVADRSAVQEVHDKIVKEADKFALIYFYAVGCEFCKAQDGIIQAFIDKYGWEVKRVEINERPDLAARFDVKMTPYLMLIYRESKDYLPVSIGVSSIESIEDRVYRGMRLLSGEVNPESYTMYDFQRGGKLDPSGYTGNVEEK